MKKLILIIIAFIAFSCNEKLIPENAYFDNENIRCSDVPVKIQEAYNALSAEEKKQCRANWAKLGCVDDLSEAVHNNWLASQNEFVEFTDQELVDISTCDNKVPKDSVLLWAFDPNQEIGADYKAYIFFGKKSFQEKVFRGERINQRYTDNPKEAHFLVTAANTGTWSYVGRWIYMVKELGLAGQNYGWIEYDWDHYSETGEKVYSVRAVEHEDGHAFGECHTHGNVFGWEKMELDTVCMRGKDSEQYRRNAHFYRKIPAQCWTWPLHDYDLMFYYDDCECFGSEFMCDKLATKLTEYNICGIRRYYDMECAEGLEIEMVSLMFENEIPEDRCERSVNDIVLFDLEGKACVGQITFIDYETCDADIYVYQIDKTFTRNESEINLMQ